MYYILSIVIGVVLGTLFTKLIYTRHNIGNLMIVEKGDTVEGLFLELDEDYRDVSLIKKHSYVMMRVRKDTQD